MQQFVVPQFIDVEDKVIGPITVRQFIILLVGAGIVFIAYKLSSFAAFIVEFIVIAVLTFGVAFIKVNGKPIHYLLLNIIQTIRRPRIRVWNKQVTVSVTKAARDEDEEIAAPVASKNKVRASRLAELSLIVDTGGVYQGEEGRLPNEKLI
jgi:hypothetical protein